MPKTTNSGGYRTRHSQGAPIEDKHGKPLLTKEAQNRRGVEHFQETLNQPAPEKILQLEPAEYLLVTDGSSGLVEVMVTMHTHKYGKAAGMDETDAEMLKNRGRELMQALTDLVKACWVDAKVSEDWQEGVIVRLPKKDYLADCNNWRGITLLSVTLVNYP